MKVKNALRAIVGFTLVVAAVWLVYPGNIRLTLGLLALPVGLFLLHEYVDHSRKSAFPIREVVSRVNSDSRHEDVTLSCGHRLEVYIHRRLFFPCEECGQNREPHEEK